MKKKGAGFFGINLNKIVKYLVFSDLVFYSGWGLISPIFAIFILNLVAGGSALVAGMAAGINLITRSALRVPFGIYSDKSQKIAYRMMFFGLLVSAFVPLGYIFSRVVWQIYILQAILGASLAMSTAGWTCIYSRNLDRGKESTEWGVDAVAVGLGPGIAAMLGGAAVNYFSFNAVFLAATIVGLVGVSLLLFVKKDIFRSKDVAPEIISRRAFRKYINHHHRVQA